MTKFAGAIVSATVELTVNDYTRTNPFTDLNKDDLAETREVGGTEPDFSKSRKSSAIVEIQRNVAQFRLQNVSHFDALTPTQALGFTDRAGLVINQSYK